MNGTAVVTGASRGIGKEIARSLAEAGMTIAAVATSLEGAESAAASLPGTGHKGFACDISSSEQVDALAAATLEALGPAKVLVNNAGVTHDTLILRMKDEDWLRVLQVNLTGTFNMIRAYTRQMMKERYGRIINLSSIIAASGAAGQANYSAAKAGVEGLTRSTAKEFGSRGITCCAVAPGFIETDMTADLPEKMRTYVCETAPAGRLGTPADIAAVVKFLASEESSYITGQVITVDGGLTL